MRVFLITSAVLSLSLATPALADEGGGDGSDQPITTESSAESTQTPALWRALLVEENQPDEDQGALRDLDALETQAAEELALEELRVMDAQTEEELLYQTTERSVAVSRLTEVERRGTRRNAGVLGTIAAVGGLGGVGFVGGVFIGTGVCVAAGGEEWACLAGGGSAGAAVGALLGMYQGYRWARPNSSNGSSSRDVEQSDSQVFEFLPIPLAIVGGLAALFGSDEIGAPPYIGDGDSSGPLLTLGGVGMVGAAVYLAQSNPNRQIIDFLPYPLAIVGLFTIGLGSDNILDGDPVTLLVTAGGVGMVGAAVYLDRRNSRSGAGESPISLSVSPYRHDDASGLMFSSQF